MIGNEALVGLPVSDACFAGGMADLPGYSRIGIESGAPESGTDEDLLDERAAAFEREMWLRHVLAAEARERARLSAPELLGRGILRLRLFMGWSQKDVERASGVDQSTLSRLENGKAANVGSARIGAVLGALRASDVVILPRLPTVEPTALELMLRGDPWKRAIAEADRRVNLRRSA